jgi:hypothetical protein
MSGALSVPSIDQEYRDSPSKFLAASATTSANLPRPLNATEHRPEQLLKPIEHILRNLADLLSQAWPVAGLGSNHPRDLFYRMIVGVHSYVRKIGVL